MLLFFNIVTALELVQKRSAVQTAEGQQRLFIHIPFIRSYKGMDTGWGEREDRRADRNPAHQRWPLLPDLLSACGLLTSLQNNTRHPQQLRWAPRAKRWSWNPAAAEESPLGRVRWAQKMRSPHIAVCPCLKKLHCQPQNEQ